MYATDKFVFLHLPKSGGTTIMHYLPRLLDMNIKDESLKMGVKGIDVKYHQPVIFLAEDLRHLPRFGFIRNPWAWYVSYGTWCHNNFGDGPTWGVMSEGLKPGTEDYFTETVKRILSIGDGTDASRRYVNEMKKVYKRVGPRGRFMTPYNYFEHATEFGAGYFTWWMKSIFYNVFSPEPEDSVEIGQMENLTTDYLRIVGQYVDLTPEYITEIQGLNAQRVRKDKEPYQEYYDRELATLVAERDKEIIDRFGYTFEQEEKLS